LVVVFGWRSSVILSTTLVVDGVLINVD